jgi:hypothetical protein
VINTDNLDPDQVVEMIIKGASVSN